MYIFEAHYINTTGKETTRSIEFNGYNFFDNDKDRYLYAMEEAFDMMGDNETLLSLEFIAC